MTPEQIDRLEAEADEALKQATATPETDKVEAAQEVGGGASRTLMELKPKWLNQKNPRRHEPNAEEAAAAAASRT